MVDGPFSDAELRWPGRKSRSSRMVEGRPSHVERNGAGKTRRQENRKGTKAFSRCNERDGSEARCLPEHELNSNTASTRTNPCRLYRQGFRFAAARLAQGITRPVPSAMQNATTPASCNGHLLTLPVIINSTRRLRRVAFTLGSFSAARLVVASRARSGVADSDSPATPPKCLPPLNPTR